MSSFESLGIRAEILLALNDLGFTKPTPVQAATIPLLLADEGDMVALARTGTGKTAAFGIPLLERVDPAVKAVQGLVLAPTRELCVQITKDIDRLAAHCPGCGPWPCTAGPTSANRCAPSSAGPTWWWPRPGA
jgi:ATP-dependent RNA helicase DeaD